MVSGYLCDILWQSVADIIFYLFFSVVNNEMLITTVKYGKLHTLQILCKKCDCYMTTLFSTGRGQFDWVFFPCGREVRRIRQDVFEFLGVRLVLPLQEEHHRQHDVPAALPDDLRHPPHLLLPLDLQPGIVTIKFESEAPTFNDWLESSHVRFLAHDYLDGPRQRRAFWADSVPLVDMSCLVVKITC